MLKTPAILWSLGPPASNLDMLSKPEFSTLGLLSTVQTCALMGETPEFGFISFQIRPAEVGENPQICLALAVLA